MADVWQSGFQNYLLRRLPQTSLVRFETYLERIEVPRSHQLSSPHQPMEHAYFFESGIASVVIRSPEGQHSEIGIIGRDGMCPTAAILGVDADPFSIHMQMQGDAYRIPSSVLKAVLSEDREVHTLFARYTQALAVQQAYTALSNAVHHIDERLARWILMCHDRVDGEDISLTHEFMAVMLAVRRPSVTTALHVLEGKKLIYSERGVVSVRNRTGLEAFARDAYGECEKEYGRLIGASLGQSTT
ncbi:Crp/Fnr family transcriptional regulator [Shinella sp. CPCC 101442]|uniref:Crp/Fnr family transcriptional regulator n=1 Tax=Shinella sp. CPCC 101442 TaxID=2932265 RepID=UPI002152B9C4|nr:Crp/Fnr family transcriptional regulator [Shinella sp. CPCC 101442]MCR6501996.1 Crp/Fnr family transcriptional regulator [Shinella sp. CPCC 101442]